MFDLIVRNGFIIDGTGKPGYVADIAITNGKIALIGNALGEAKAYIDASGLVITPGFIDSHSHADKKVLQFPEQREKLEQGITTSVAGQCGGSAAPEFLSGITMKTFVSELSNMKLGANLMLFVGHGNIRRAVMGESGRTPTDAEMNQMLAILREAFEDGAAGLSFGLFYAPGCYASEAEAYAMAKVAAEYNRPVSAHIRNESDFLIEAVEEFISVIRLSGARGILSHHKAVRKHNWGKVLKTMELLRNAVEDGVDIYCDLYPYCASSTTLSQAFVPFSWRADGTQMLLQRIADPGLYNKNKDSFIELNGSRLDWVLINSCPGSPQYEGMTVDQIAKIHGKDDFDTAVDLVVSSNDKASACFFTVSEADLMHVLDWDRTMICTDSGMADINKKFHPRMVGSFPRAISRYVREQRVLELPEMIRRMTTLPAFVYGLNTKGKIAEEYDADLCIFDPDVFHNPSDFKNCRQKTEGLHYVLVGGQVVAENGLINGCKCGKVLTK